LVPAILGALLVAEVRGIGHAFAERAGTAAQGAIAAA